MKTFGWKSISVYSAQCVDWPVNVGDQRGYLEAQAINHITVHITVIKDLIGTRSQRVFIKKAGRI